MIASSHQWFAVSTTAAVIPAGCSAAIQRQLLELALMMAQAPIRAHPNTIWLTQWYGWQTAVSD